MLSELQINTAVAKMIQDPVSMVVSPTATGKSTLLPIALQRRKKQISGRPVRIVVAVPTRIAAESLKSWVQERNPNSIVDARFSNKPMLPTVDVLYSTAGFVVDDYVKALRIGGILKSFPWDFVIIDEFHTGSLQNSLILSLHEIMTRKLMAKDLSIPHLVLMSATPGELNKLPLFQLAYNNRLEMQVPRTIGNVALKHRTIYLNKAIAPKDVTKQMAETIKQICTQKDRYSVLAFVEGLYSLNLLWEALKRFFSKTKDIQVLRAYGGMSAEERNAIFSDVPSRVRRIVIATNVAESSVSVPKVGYVVDSMLYKRPARGIVGAKISLETSYIPLSSALQRKGRAGRGNIPYQIYYPMVTESEWKTKIVSVPFRIPDIQLIALERTALMFIDYGFNPRKILEEAGPEIVSQTLLNLIDSNIIAVTDFYIIDQQFKLAQQEEQQLFERIARGEKVEPALAFPLAAQGVIEEKIEITELGRFWNLYATGLLPALALWHWLKNEKAPLMGCLVAAIMDSNFDKLFPTPAFIRPSSTSSTARPSTDTLLKSSKRDYYAEILPDYISDDPFTTILCVLYDFFKAHPVALSLEIDYGQTKRWADIKGLHAPVLYDILSSWKAIVSRLNEESYYDFDKTLEIHEVVAALIDSLKDQDFFQLKKAGAKTYYRHDSKVRCFIDKNSVPYEPFGLPNELLFLSINESSRELDEKIKTESCPLFVPSLFLIKSHLKQKFQLPYRPFRTVLLFEDTDSQSMDVRLPVVQSEDIGLTSGTFPIPLSLSLPGDDKIQSARREFDMAVYPEMLPPLIYGRRREQKESNYSSIFDVEDEVELNLDYNFDDFSEFEFLGLAPMAYQIFSAGLGIENPQEFGGPVEEY